MGLPACLLEHQPLWMKKHEKASFFKVDYPQVTETQTEQERNKITNLHQGWTTP